MNARFLWTRVFLTVVIVGALVARFTDVLDATMATAVISAAALASLILILIEWRRRPRH